jgi:hypothetical protein
MNEPGQPTRSWWKAPTLSARAKLQEREDQVLFSLGFGDRPAYRPRGRCFHSAPEHVGMRIYPPGALVTKARVGKAMEKHMPGRGDEKLQEEIYMFIALPRADGIQLRGSEFHLALLICDSG